MKREETLILWRMVLSAVLLLVCVLLPTEGLVRLLLFFIPYLIIGWDVLWRAVRGILKRDVFDENFLMALATVGAFCIGEYPEGVFVMLFYQLGEFFQERAVEKSRRSITELMDMMPEYATVEEDGGLRQVAPDKVEVGQILLVKPGEKLPLDGVVTEGFSSLNTMALTGESVPRDVAPGDELWGGCVNMTGLLRIRVTRRFEESAVSKILKLVENAAESKAKTESFITRFARRYTPAVVLAALALAVIPSLLWGDPSLWIYRALSFLVVSCPCALVLSVPLSFFGGIGGAARHGILIKGANYIEALAQAEMVAFDKTGTLTRGTFAVTQIVPQAPWTEETLLDVALLAEQYSEHPLAISLRAASATLPDSGRAGDFQLLPGKGVEARIDGRRVLAGNQALMEEEGFSPPTPIGQGTLIHLAAEGVYAGYILLSDQLKEDAGEAVRALRDLGIRKIALLTGDNAETAREVSAVLALDEVYAALLPQDKVTCVETLLQQRSSKGKLLFVGDGVNDAPVLTRADVGIAMGALGSDAAMEAADVVLMDDDPRKVALAIRIAQKTMRIARQNIVFSLLVKALVLALALFGLATMWHAVLADVGVSLLAILNATRTLRVEKSMERVSPAAKTL